MIQIIVVLVLVLLLTPFGVAQQKSKIKYHSPTVKGSSGLFNLPTADTFREGEFSIGMYGTHFNREAGQLDISLFPVTFTVGLTDRIEFFGSYEVYQRVHANAIAVNTVSIASSLESRLGANPPSSPTLVEKPFAFNTSFNV